MLCEKLEIMNKNHGRNNWLADEFICDKQQIAENEGSAALPRGISGCYEVVVNAAALSDGNGQSLLQDFFAAIKG